jgi:hypothetical protein
LKRIVNIAIAIVISGVHLRFSSKLPLTVDCEEITDRCLNLTSLFALLAWREKRLEMALIQISVPARENYRVIKGF